MTDGSDPKNDKVGPGNPPKEHQFKKGTSGNPKGRPRKRELSYERAWQKGLQRDVTIVEGGSRKQVTAMEALITSLINGALKGDRRAAKMVLEYQTTLLKHQRTDLGKYMHDTEQMSDEDLEATIEQFAKERHELKNKK